MVVYTAVDIVQGVPAYRPAQPVPGVFFSGSPARGKAFAEACSTRAPLNKYRHHLLWSASRVFSLKSVYLSSANANCRTTNHKVMVAYPQPTTTTAVANGITVETEGDEKDTVQ